jgi:hypothetical protein
MVFPAAPGRSTYRRALSVYPSRRRARIHLAPAIPSAIIPGNLGARSIRFKRGRGKRSVVSVPVDELRAGSREDRERDTSDANASRDDVARTQGASALESF